MKSLAFVLGVAMSASAFADVLYLKDGGKIEGDVKRGENGFIVNQAGASYQVIPFNLVKSIELAPTTQPKVEFAREGLQSLRRSVAHSDDIPGIVDRYERFIEANLGTPVAEEAKQDLAVWEQRRLAGLVRFGNDWVTPADKAQRQEQLIGVADQVRKLMRQGRLKEAETSIQQILTDDPQNASALYLRGLLQYKQDQIQQARRSFEQVNTLVPNHAPTLNNIGVIQYRQNQFGPALASYDTAMMAWPGNKDVLNNVAEALYALPDTQRDTPVAQRVARRFTEQDVDLQNEMQKESMHRWGATWVTTDQREQLKAAEKQQKDKLDALSADFDAIKVKISNIDREIEENERAMRRLEATSYVRDAFGNIYQSVLPSTYYDLQKDNQKMSNERDEQYARLEKLRYQAKQVNQDFPIPKYTGIQRIVDVEGTPVQAPGGATTKPAETTTKSST